MSSSSCAKIIHQVPAASSRKVAIYKISLPSFRILVDVTMSICNNRSVKLGLKSAYMTSKYCHQAAMS